MRKKIFLKFGKWKGMEKSIPILRERESEAFIPGNGREQEFTLTPDLHHQYPPSSRICSSKTILDFRIMPLSYLDIVHEQ